MLAVLADSRRRRILSILGERFTSVDERELAVRLVAADRETSEEDVAPEEVRAVRVDLRHVHLPTLDDAGLVSWDEAESRVIATAHPALHDPLLADVIETDDEGVDELLACLADERRRVVLAVLDERADPASRAVLAHEVAAREAGGDPPSSAVEETMLSLHHVHLPKLRDAGLVEYDPEDETVTFSGHPDLETEWFDVPERLTYDPGKMSAAGV